MAPVRVVDTRQHGSPMRTLEAGETATVQITGETSVPAGASAVAANITAAGATSAGYLTVFPCGGDTPNTSTVNFAGGVVTPNSTIATLSADGELCVFASERTDLLIDISGYFAPSGPLGFEPVAAVRAADTRLGFPHGRVARDQVLRVDVAAALEVSEVSAIAANVTAVNSSGPGYLTAWACDDRPVTSIVNFVAGSASPNNAIVPVSASGELCVYASESTELIVDVVGVFSADGELGYSALSPWRTLDTRGAGSPTAGAKIVFNVLGGGLSGPRPVAAAVNLTSSNHQAAGFMTSYNCGPIPHASAMNQRPGVDVANGAHVPVTADGTSCLHADTAGDFIVDVLGFWMPTT